MNASRLIPLLAIVALLPSCSKSEIGRGAFVIAGFWAMNRLARLVMQRDVNRRCREWRERLAELRSQGLLSEEEFSAFSERFTKSTGEKSSEIINAIKDLHAQRQSGALTEGNYKASLRTLMDKLDRRT